MGKIARLVSVAAIAAVSLAISRPEVVAAEPPDLVRLRVEGVIDYVEFRNEFGTLDPAIIPVTRRRALLDRIYRRPLSGTDVSAG